MDQLELVFQLLVRLQFMYLQYKHCGAHKHIYTQVIQNNLRTPQLAGFPASWGIKTKVLFYFAFSNFYD